MSKFLLVEMRPRVLDTDAGASHKQVIPLTSIVAAPDEGAEICRQLAYYDELSTGDYFARLAFTIDVSRCDVESAISLVNELNAVHDGIEVYVSSGNLVDFDYYVTADLRTMIRAIAARYTSRHDATLIFWNVGER